MNKYIINAINNKMKPPALTRPESERSVGEGVGIWGGGGSRAVGLGVGEWNSENLPYSVANTYGLNFIKIGGIGIFRGAEAPIQGLTKSKRSWNSGNLPYSVANTYGLNFIKIGGIGIFRGAEAPIRGLTKSKRSWNSGNLPYLVANTYGLNFIEIGGISIFKGGRSPLLGGLHVICDVYFRARMSYCSQKSCMKIWLGLVKIGGIWIFRGVGQKPPIRGGYMWPAMPIFEPGRAVQSKVMCENLVRICWAFQELSW